MILGVIGGSGLYNLDTESQPERIEVHTPFGAPSGPIFKYSTAENSVLFLARHGEGHKISPSEINYRANIFALKKLGATSVLSISAVGSMKAEIEPGDFVLPSQYIDWTRGTREKSFFGDGVVAHAHFADPACSFLRSNLATLIQELGVKVHRDGTYICMEGPQFSTRAESRLYRGWGVDVIGMTAMPEARLAREALLCYQTVAMATDYDCWKEDGEDVSVEAILNVLKSNVDTSRKLVQSISEAKLENDGSCGCKAAMEHAVITAKESWTDHRRADLGVILS